MLKIKGIKAPNENTAGLSTTLKKKFTMKNTKSIAKASEDFKGLQQTLQEAGKIPVSRPPATNFEKIVMLENGHNVYQNALFSMQVSISKDNSVEQKSLLMESFEYIKKGVEDEEKLKRIIIDNSASVKIAEHLMNYEVKGANVLEKQPLNLMDKTRYLKKTNVPPKPIFLSRTSTTITMRLPYFRPMTDHKEWRNIDKMALFGKESGSGVAVSLNNTEFPGTGDRVNPGSIVTVSALSPNKKYVFACGGYTVDNTCVNGIGETSEEILTALPLNLNILYGYLSQIAFKLRQLQISKKAAETLLTQFIDKNETRYRMINGERNPVLLFKLKYSDINMISVTTIRQIVEAFLILASISKLQKVNFEKQPIGVDSIQVKKTKLQLRICNFLLLALELSILLKNPILIKRTVSELFNHTLPFLSFDPRPEFLKNYLIYVHQAILMIPGDHMDGSIRRIGSCLSYEIHKDQIYHLKDQENELYRKLLMTEISIDLRKWQTYSQIVTKIDQLTEEQLIKQKEQREILAKGEEIATDLLIKDPEPYEVSETYVVERELEGKAYEEFLLVFKNEYTEARAEKWKVKLNKLVPVLTNGEEVIESLTKEIDQTVSFWKGVKENPEEQIRNEALKENPRFLEFVCKAFQRVIELGQKSNEELQELVKGVVLDEETMKNLEDSIQQTKSNLANDTVQRRQNRFTLIEEKVKNMQEQREDVAIEEVELPKLFVAIRKELASSDQFQKTDYKPSQLRYFLQVSQFLYVKAMVRTLINRQKYEYRQDTGLPAYQNIQLLDFSDVITQSNDFKDQLMSARQRIRDEMIEQKQNEKQDQINQPADGEGDKDRIPDEHEIELPVEDKIKAITETISLLSRACQYGQVSKSWVLLENIVKYTWNLISYELVSPLELSQTDAYKDIFLITESVLNLLSHMKLSTETEDKSTASESVVGDRTIKFQDEQGTNFVPEKRIIINEADLKFYSGFIAYTIQCLFVAEKWESMVDLADIAAKQFLMISPDPDDDLLFLLSYLLQFRIYGEDKLYSAASEETQRVKYALEERIREFQHWKATSKKSKSRQALLTGEVPKEELQFRKDKLTLHKEAFRLEVHDTILKSDKIQSEKELDRLKKASNNTKESLRQSRKVYKKYGLETRELERELESQGHNKLMALKAKNHSIYTNMVISSYNKSIELIRKRQEKFLLIQSLHEVGNLYYSDNQLRHAETQWND